MKKWTTEALAGENGTLRAHRDLLLGAADLIRKKAERKYGTWVIKSYLLSNLDKTVAYVKGAKAKRSRK